MPPSSSYPVVRETRLTIAQSITSHAPTPTRQRSIRVQTQQPTPGRLLLNQQPTRVHGPRPLDRERQRDGELGAGIRVEAQAFLRACKGRRPCGKLCEISSASASVIGGDYRLPKRTWAARRRDCQSKGWELKEKTPNLARTFAQTTTFSTTQRVRVGTISPASVGVTAASSEALVASTVHQNACAGRASARWCMSALSVPAILAYMRGGTSGMQGPSK